MSRNIDIEAVLFQYFAKSVYALINISWQVFDWAHIFVSNVI